MMSRTLPFRNERVDGSPHSRRTATGITRLPTCSCHRLHRGDTWGGGARPNVVVHAGEAAAAALVTATYDEHLEEVALPPLLAAILSGRLPSCPPFRAPRRAAPPPAARPAAAARR